jgi:hypothetical protein
MATRNLYQVVHGVISEKILGASMCESHSLFLVVLVGVVEEDGLLLFDSNFVCLLGMVFEHRVDTQLCLDLLFLRIPLENQGQTQF